MHISCSQHLHTEPRVCILVVSLLQYSHEMFYIIHDYFILTCISSYSLCESKPYSASKLYTEAKDLWNLECWRHTIQPRCQILRVFWCWKYSKDNRSNWVKYLTCFDSRMRLLGNLHIVCCCPKYKHSKLKDSKWIRIIFATNHVTVFLITRACQAEVPLVVAMTILSLKNALFQVALHFVKDERTRFALALECGNIEVWIFNSTYTHCRVIT